MQIQCLLTAGWVWQDGLPDVAWFLLDSGALEYLSHSKTLADATARNLTQERRHPFCNFPDGGLRCLFTHFQGPGMRSLSQGKWFLESNTY